MRTIRADPYPLDTPNPNRPLATQAVMYCGHESALVNRLAVNLLVTWPGRRFSAELWHLHFSIW